jgi:hypothetical protein
LTTQLADLSLRHAIAFAALDLSAANPPASRLRRHPQPSRRHETDSIDLAYAYLLHIDSRNTEDAKWNLIGWSGSQAR